MPWSIILDVLYIIYASGSRERSQLETSLNET